MSFGIRPDFVNKFHNLPGPTLGAKKKNLFHLLRQISFDEYDLLIPSLIPKNHLERLLKIEILLKLERNVDLIQMLESGDEILIIEIIKNKTFCKNFTTFVEENSDGFVRTTLARMSFVTKMRLISQLEIYGRNMDTVFDKLEERYGMSVAKKIIIGCSPKKIEEKMKQIQLTPRQLKLFYKKHTKLFKSYLNFRIKNGGFSGDEDCFIHHIASDSLDLFVKIVLSQCPLHVTIGKRLTRRLAKDHKEVILTNSPEFIRFLKQRTIFKRLPISDFKRFHLENFPANYQTYQLFRHFGNLNMPKKFTQIFYNIIKEGIEKLWKKSIYDYPDIITDDFLSKINAEEREKWIEVKTKSGIPLTDLLKFKSTNHSIPAIKKKIDVTSDIRERQKLVISLVDTCRINNHDLEALLEVEKYIYVRHRNDYNNIVEEFVGAMNNFGFNHLQEDHWKVMNSLIEFYLLKTSEEFYCLKIYYLSYAEFLFKNNKLENDMVLKILKSYINIFPHDFNFKNCNDNFKKMLLIKSYELLPLLMDSEKYKIENYDMTLLNAIINWNKKHVDNVIPVFEKERLLESFKKKVDLKDIRDLNEIFFYLLQETFKTTSKFRQEKEVLLKMISKETPIASKDVYLFILKHDAELFVRNDLVIFETLVEYLSGNYFERDVYEVAYMVQNYPDLNLSNKLNDINLKLLSPEACSEKSAVFTAFACLVQPEKFLWVLSNYVPVLEKLDETIENPRFSNNITRGAIKGCKYTRSGAVLLKLLDYSNLFLGEALESIYYLFLHSAENDLKPVIENMSRQRVSLRKHAIFLTCRFGTPQEVDDIFKYFNDTEKNVSVRKHLFSAAFKYFLKHPSERCWEFLKIFMSKLDLENDSESLEYITTLHKLPDEYKAKHVIFVWELLKKQNEDFSKQIIVLLSRIDFGVFKSLPLDFILQVITENFPSNDFCGDFVCLALEASPFTNEVFDAIFSIILKMKNEEFELRPEKEHTMGPVFNFVSNIVRRFGKQGSSAGNREILSTFIIRWNSVFTPTEAITEFIQLSLSIFMIDYNSDLEKLAEKIANFFQECFSKYNMVILGVFANVLKETFSDSFICYHEEDFDANFFNFYYNLLKGHETDSVFCLLIIKSLPAEVPCEEKGRKHFFEIVNILKQVPEESVKMYLNLYLKTLKQVTLKPKPDCHQGFEIKLPDVSSFYPST